MGALSALGRVVAAQADARPLAILRIVIGLTAALCGVEAWNHLKDIVRPGGLRVPFVPGLTLFPEDWLSSFMAVWFGTALLLTMGWWTRSAGTLLACAMVYVLLVDQQTYSNHLYLLSLEAAFLVLGNAGACWSVDARSRGSIARVPAWPITLWKIQISIVYFFAALAKFNPTFLSGEVLATYWPTTGLLEFLASWREPALLRPMAWIAVAVELFIALALWLPALRRAALLAGLGLHAGMILLVSQKDPLGIIVFALATLPPYLLFFRWEREA